MKPRAVLPSPFRLPLWASRFAQGRRRGFSSDEERMRFVIELASMNVVKESGGPFAAAVFETHSGRLVAIGLNLVVSTNCSLAHAELVALANAQQAVRNFDLGAAGLPEHELATSSEPCAMCYGAIPWSGVRRILCGARARDAETIGFDEGPKPKRWVAELKKRHITVVRDLCRAEAVAVLQQYKKGGGDIYNTCNPTRQS